MPGRVPSCSFFVIYISRTYLEPDAYVGLKSVAAIVNNHYSVSLGDQERALLVMSMAIYIVPTTFDSVHMRYRQT